MNAVKIKSHKNNLIEGPLLLKPNIYIDDRGFFYESWNEKCMENLVAENINFVQDNHSRSKLGVIRGMHYQIPPKEQAKLVRCTYGEIYDVIVDLRMHSNTFGEWFGVYLNVKNKLQLWIPKGFAHGFLSLEENTEVQYKANEFWDRKCERSLKWNDEEISIKWPTKKGKKLFKIQTNEKDSKALNFNQIKEKGAFFN